MLREFRRSDAPEYLRLLTENFPEESRLLGWRPEGLRSVVDRIYRWDARLVLRLLGWAGRPVVRFFVVVEGGHVVAAAILTFGEAAGEVSSVVVAPASRRRGYARRLLAACETGARRAHRRFTVLDVLSTNAPARALYASLGYRTLRSQLVFSRELDGASGPGPEGSNLPGVRAFLRADAGPLAEVARRGLPSPVLEVLPVGRGDFAIAPIVLRFLRSESAAWVVDPGDGPVGFLRATASPATQAGNLTAPLVADGAGVESARALVRTGVDWLHRRGLRRAITQVPSDRGPALEAMREEGFHEAYGVETLSKPVVG